MRSLVLAGILVLIPLGASAGLIDINTAGVAELDTLPGIGPAKAQAIVAYRTEHGSFARVEDLVEVKGIGPSTYEGLKNLVTVSGGGQVPSQEKPLTTSPRSPLEQTNTAAAPISITTNDHAPEPAAAPENVAALAYAPTSTIMDMFTSSWTLIFFALVALAGGVLLIR